MNIAWEKNVMSFKGFCTSIQQYASLSVMVVLSFRSSNAAFAKMKIVTEGIQSALH